MILRSATLSDGRRVDVRLLGGEIAEVAPLLELEGDESLDLDGYVLLPGLVEPHLHLDTVFTAESGEPLSGGLDVAVERWLVQRTRIDSADVYARGERAVRLAVRRGVTVLRGHVDVGEGIELRALDALLALRENWRELVHIELVAMADTVLTGTAGAAARGWLETALEAGVDVVGGAPWLDPDPTRCVELLLDIAAASGRPLDLHVDETLDPTSPALVELARAVVARNFDLPVTAGHCSSLGVVPEDKQRERAVAVATAGVSVVTLPATNLYLLGRDIPVARPRGLTALGPLLAAGVTVAAGSDNVRDAFNPVGAPDPLRTAGLLVLAGQISPSAALRAVTVDARKALRRPAVEIAPGCAADLVAVVAGSLEEALAEAGEERIVFRNGRVVSDTRVSASIAPNIEPLRSTRT